MSQIEKAQARLRFINDRAEQIATLKAQAAELKRLGAEVFELQIAWQVALVDGCGDLFVAVRRYEGELIRCALEKSGGGLGKAATLLNVSYQALGYIIDNRQTGLLRFRSKRRTRAANSPMGDKQ